MSLSVFRVLIATACVLWLAGCSSSGKLGELAEQKPADATSAGAATAEGEPAATGSVGELPPELPALTPTGTAPGLLGSDPNDDLTLGKRHFRAADFGTAERHFRRAVETHPRDAEAWLGLAASYDRLKRFDLADRAYEQVLAISGPRVEILNNQGFSLILRGDYRRAREKLRAANAADPNNPHVKANLQLLEESTRKGKAVQ